MNQEHMGVILGEFCEAHGHEFFKVTLEGEGWALHYYDRKFFGSQDRSLSVITGRTAEEIAAQILTASDVDLYLKCWVDSRGDWMLIDSEGNPTLLGAGSFSGLIRHYERDFKRKWKDESNERIQQEANKMGLTFDAYLAYRFHKANFQAEAGAAQKTLKHYFGLTMDLTSDMRAELDHLVYNLLEAAFHKLQMHQIEQQGKAKQTIKGPF